MTELVSHEVRLLGIGHDFAVIRAWLDANIGSPSDTWRYRPTDEHVEIQFRYHMSDETAVEFVLLFGGEFKSNTGKEWW